MSTAHDQYALGRSPQEYARLARQAEIMKPMTLRLFSEAGIRPAMNVLDLASGAGDVAMLLAEMVGPSGNVIGLDLDRDATVHARERITAAQFRNITFVHSDFAHYRPDAPLGARHWGLRRAICLRPSSRRNIFSKTPADWDSNSAAASSAEVLQSHLVWGAQLRYAVVQ